MTGLMHEPLLVPEIEELLVEAPPATTPDGEISKRLIAARKLLEQGWLQGESHRKVYERKHPWSLPKDRHLYCISGAVRAVSENVAELDRTSSFVNMLVYEETRSRQGMIGFNDEPSTTKRDVLKLMDRVIDKARKEGL